MKKYKVLGCTHLIGYTSSLKCEIWMIKSHYTSYTCIITSTFLRFSILLHPCNQIQNVDNMWNVFLSSYLSLLRIILMTPHTLQKKTPTPKHKLKNFSTSPSQLYHPLLHLLTAIWAQVFKPRRPFVLDEYRLPTTSSYRQIWNMSSRWEFRAPSLVVGFYLKIRRADYLMKQRNDMQSSTPYTYFNTL